MAKCKWRREWENYVAGQFATISGQVRNSAPHLEPDLEMARELCFREARIHGRRGILARQVPPEAFTSDRLFSFLIGSRKFLSKRGGEVRWTVDEVDGIRRTIQGLPPPPPSSSRPPFPHPETALPWFDLRLPGWKCPEHPTHPMNRTEKRSGIVRVSCRRQECAVLWEGTAQSESDYIRRLEVEKVSRARAHELEICRWIASWREVGRLTPPGGGGWWHGGKGAPD